MLERIAVWSVYGPPTGSKVEYRAIADCIVKRNMVVEEWLIRDELTLLHQLGLDPYTNSQRDGSERCRKWAYLSS